MNRKDIQGELDWMVREMKEWSARLAPASPALSDLFRQEGEYLEARKPRDFDTWGISTRAGKVKGMIAAASVLLDEWTRNRG